MKLLYILKKKTTCCSSLIHFCNCFIFFLFVISRSSAFFFHFFHSCFNSLFSFVGFLKILFLLYQWIFLIHLFFKNSPLIIHFPFFLFFLSFFLSFFLRKFVDLFTLRCIQRRFVFIISCTFALAVSCRTINRKYFDQTCRVFIIFFPVLLFLFIFFFF